MAKKNNMLLYAGAGLAGLFLLSKFKASGAATPVTSQPLPTPSPTGNNVNLTNGTTRNWDPASPDLYANSTYPAMLKANPNVGNPNYRLTDAEAQQYLNNYLDLRQSLTGLSQSRGIPLLDVARDHWKTNAVPEKRTFMPLVPSLNIPYTGVVETKTAGSGSWLTDALSIVTTVAALVGVNDPILNQREAEVLINSGGIVTGFLPLFKDDPMYPAIDAKLTSLLEYYISD